MWCLFCKLFACWVILHAFFVVCIFFFNLSLLFFFFKKQNKKKNPEKNLSEYHQSAKQFGARSGLIWVQTVCKGYQQTAKVATSGEIVNVCSSSFLLVPLRHFLVILINIFARFLYILPITQDIFNSRDFHDFAQRTRFACCCIMLFDKGISKGHVQNLMRI